MRSRSKRSPILELLGGGGLLLELAGRGDDHRLGGRAGLRADRLDRRDDVHALQDATKDDVLAVEPRGHHGGDEELSGGDGWWWQRLDGDEWVDT